MLTDADESWDVIPFLPHPPETTTDGETWHEVAEHGPGVLTLWCLRHDRAASSPAGVPPLIRVTLEDAAGRRSRERPRTPQEQSDVDDDLDDLLAEAGAPPRPRGRRWFVRLPPDRDLKASLNEWWQVIYQRLADVDQTPAEEFRVLREILAREGLRE
ncbi:DUF5956 family protein [Nocardioides sp. cx-169]|uniref:DUF5956 family protein n=1 Tax=Nocardioides sp. cx-169 TaxID=2899080 RepID=UPI001E5CCAC6|nr:DUF5956 family protein [Nocardioides sp. cx-169]MCD4536554.1 DUF5956 family protein [Nocardioides sp. cx-169]